MDIQISGRKKGGLKTFVLYILLLALLLIPGYLCFKIFINEEEIVVDENIEQEESKDEEVEEEIPVPPGPPEEILQVIEGQQAYIVVPSVIDEKNPPILIMYSHGSNTNVTENMEDPFMQDLKGYGLLFTQYNYIFAASNQHGVNWGNTASIQDTLNLKDWIDSNYLIQEKVYLLGFSMGGLPTLNFTTTYPELVSKIALLAPTTKTSEWSQTRADKVKDLDIKIWHGNKDVNVPYSTVVYFVNSMKRWGIDIEFITLEGKTHFDIDTEYMEDILTFFNR